MSDHTDIEPAPGTRPRGTAVERPGAGSGSRAERPATARVPEPTRAFLALERRAFVTAGAARRTSVDAPSLDGVQIHEGLAPRSGETVLKKHFPNAFRGTALESELRSRGIGRLVVAGMMTDLCIDTSVRVGFDLGFEIDLACDACATRSLRFGEAEIGAPEVHASFIAALHGTFATARSAAQIAADG